MESPYNGGDNSPIKHLMPSNKTFSVRNIVQTQREKNRLAMARALSGTEKIAGRNKKRRE